MSTFRAVNDETLIELIRRAERRIVYIAPGLYLPVAKAIGARFELGKLEITLVLDADEDVCWIGFGELAALQEAHRPSGIRGARLHRVWRERSSGFPVSTREG